MSINKEWNRSSAHTPEVLAILTTATNMAIQNAIETVDMVGFTDEQKAEAFQLIARGVTDGIAEFAERLKR